MAEIRGGAQFERAMQLLAEMVGDNPAILRVGFLENATYPNGTPVAMIAAIHNYGAPRAGIPARPFFTNMIAKKSPEWPSAIAGLLAANDYDVELVLDITGQAIAGQLRQEIIDTNAPPLAPSTIRRKGFAKPLIETSNMINSVDHEIEGR